MKGYSRKVVMFIMVVTIGLIFASSSALAVIGNCTDENAGAKTQAKANGKWYCLHKGGYKDYSFLGGECMSGLCYQWFAILCANGETAEYEIITGVCSDDSGGGGGNDCYGRSPCPVYCQSCSKPAY